MALAASGKALARWAGRAYSDVAPKDCWPVRRVFNVLQWASIAVAGYWLYRERTALI